jgi:hypothetical protein
MLAKYTLSKTRKKKYLQCILQNIAKLIFLHKNSPKLKTVNILKAKNKKKGSQKNKIHVTLEKNVQNFI